MSYILPGKFTTEKLEKRFGKYRLLGGCNYNVSFDDILNAEKKIRPKHIFRSAVDGNFSLAEIKKQGDSCIQENDLDWTMPQNKYSEKCLFLLETEYLNEYEIDKSVQIYIAGYAAHKIVKKYNNCNICASFLVESKGNPIDDEYFDCLQRGGLKVPTEMVKDILFHMCAIFEKIINDPATESDFLKMTNQKAILCDLTSLSTRQHEGFNDLCSQCICGNENKNMFIMMCSIFSNILLNNYVKKRNNKNATEKSEKAESKNKKRKLDTFNK